MVQNLGFEAQGLRVQGFNAHHNAQGVGQQNQGCVDGDKGEDEKSDWARERLEFRVQG